MNWLPGFVLLFQYMISATAGLVTQVRGPVNVKPDQIVVAENPVETGPHGLVDLQLNPGGYLRLRENSSATFSSTALADIQLTLKSGVAIVDVDDDDPPYPIKITAGAMTLQIRKAGIYGVRPDDVEVFDGQLELEKGIAVKKGYEAIAKADGTMDLKKLDKEEEKRPYAADKLKLFITPNDDGGKNTHAMNSVFAELCKRELIDVHDVKVVSKREDADYVLMVSVNRKTADMGLFGEGEMKDAQGDVVFSNRRHLDPGERNRATAGEVMRSGVFTASILMRDILNKTGWR